MLAALRKKSKAIYTGLFVTMLVILLQVWKHPEIEKVRDRFDGIFYDIRLSQTLTARPNEDATVVIIDIDEKSLAAEGRWPWSRHKVSNLIDQLTEAGVVVIAFDVLFAEPERNPVDDVLSASTSENLSSQLSQLREELDADLRMSNALQENDIILSVLFQGDDVLSDKPLETSIEADVKAINQLNALSYPGFTSNIPILQDNTPGSGFMNASIDADGFIRRASLIIKYKERLYPSLALEAARLYALADNIKVKSEKLGETQRSVKGVIVGNQLVPTDAEGRVLVPYKGEAKSFPYISATDVLNGNIDMELFDSAVVFIGTSAVGHADLRATPVGLQYPGVEVHANVFEGLINPDILHYRPDWWEGGTAVFLSLMGIFLAVLLPMLSPIRMALIGFAALFATIISNFYLWSNAHVALPLTTSIILILVLTVYNITTGFFSEANQKKFIKSIFDQYVPPAHIDKMIDNPGALNLDGERKQMSVLFSDIRSFTTISEKLSAAELKQLLNRYFNPITESIFNHHGTIDKYVGDMVMAFWGAPLDDPKHAENSIKCGFDMLEITHRLRDEFARDGLPEVNVGIGINTGDMNVGDMGSEYRRSYTVLGDSVNLGSRLEGLTKFYGVEFLVSEFTKEHCPTMDFRMMDKVRVKGKEKAVSIFEPLSESDSSNQTIMEELAQYDSAYELYLEQEWEQGIEAFNRLIAENPDRKVYQIYLERIEHLKQQPKQQDWDGSFTHTSK